MDTDDDLRARFKALLAQDAAGTPVLSRERIDAHRRGLRTQGPQQRWLTAGVVAAAAAAVVTVVIWPRTITPALDLSDISWTAPTDFLLDTPGRVLLRTVPSIDATMELTPITAAPGRGDTSGRQQ